MTYALSYGRSQDSEPDRAIPAALRLSGLFAVALAWVCLIRWPWLAVDEIDDSFYSVVADLWRRGYPPYLFAFDVKPPGFFLMASIAQHVFGPTLAALRAVAIVSDAGTTALLFLLGRRLGGLGVGIFAAATFPALSASTICNDAYSPLCLFATLAFYAASADRQQRARAGFAGLAIGAAFMVKQSAAFEATILLAYLAAQAQNAKARMRVCGEFALAAALPTLAFLVYFHFQGAAQDFLRDAGVQAVLRTSSPLEHLTLLDGLKRIPRQMASLCLLTCVAFIAAMRHREIARLRPQANVALLIVWLVAGFASLVAQHAIIVAYDAPLVAPLLLLSGLALVHGLPELGDAARWPRLLTVALSSALLAWVFSAARLEPREPADAEEKAAAIIRSAHPNGDDRVYIVNRGIWLYEKIPLLPASRYLTSLTTLCELLPGGDVRLAEIFRSSPRFVIVADRRLAAACEKPDRWKFVETRLNADFHWIGKASSEADSFDIYERILRTESAS